MSKSKSPYIGSKLIAGAVFALSASGVLAQEVANATQNGPAETVVVTGVRQALESALDVKRQASSIVDHISAEDIGQLPALDLGEALQTIPGIQLNAEGGDRANEVNLRGLPGGFIYDTTNGMNFASVGLSRSVGGVSNPFGAFEPAVFRGVTVVKSPTADLPAGGIAGYIDKKLPKALSQKRDGLSVNVGARYEQLADNIDPEISFRANKMLIDDVLAVSGTYARSTQRFRRDSINITRYETLQDEHLVRESGFATVEDYKDAVGIPQEAQLQYASEIRQFSEKADGYRESLAVNLEWQTTDDLKLGIDYLGSQRELNDNAQDVFIVGGRQFQGGGGLPRQAVVDITPEADPFLGFTEPAQFDDEGNQTSPEQDVYILSDYSFDNAQYFPGNRLRDSLERTQGVTLSADWQTDDWTVSAKYLTSESETFRINAQFDARYQPADNRANLDATSGITGRFSTGNGNLDDYLLRLDGFENLDLEVGEFRYDVRGSDNQPHEVIERHLSRSSVNNRGTNEDGSLRNLRLLSVGGETFHDRAVDTFRIDFERALDIGIFESVKFGAYHSKEEFTREVNNHTAAFVNLDGISNDLLTDPNFSSGEVFFNGNLPGFAGPETGWVSIDVNAAAEALTIGIEDRWEAALQDLRDSVTVEGGNTASDALTDEQKDQAIAYYEDVGFTSVGFLERRRETDVTQDYSSEVEIKEAYLMTDFAFDLGPVPISGNVGARYVSTINTARGTEITDIGARNGNGTNRFLWDDTFNSIVAENKYTDILPMVNVAAELTSDLVLRAAYYQGIVRPNAAAFVPGDVFTETDRRVNIEVSDTELEALTADSYDITLSWYNRAGSVFSLGYFRKDLRQTNETIDGFCPSDGSDFGLGRLEFDELGEQCFEVELTEVSGTDELGNPTTDFINREVDISIPVVTDEVSELAGLEATVQQNFDFLPGPLGNLGGQFNVSSVTVDGDRIPGVSELAYNVIAYYETPKFSTRLAYNFRDDYLLQSVGTFNGTRDRDALSRERLDLSISYKFTRDLQVTLRGFNLLDDIFQEFQSRNEALPRRTNYDGRIYSLSARYKF